MMSTKTFKPLVVPKPPRRTRISAIRRQEVIIGIAAIAVMLASILAVYLPHTFAVADQKLYNRTTYASIKIGDYIGSKGRLPVNLSATGLNSAQQRGLQYHRVAATSYQVCIHYHQAGTNAYNTDYGDSIDPLLDNIDSLTNPGQSTDYTSQDHSYLEFPLKHPAGQVCQTVKPVLPTGLAQQNGAPAAGYNTTQPATSNGCGVPGVTQYNFTGAITSIQPTGSVIHGVAEFNVQLQADNRTRTILVPETSVVFDHSCKALDHSVIQTGDTVSIFNRLNLNPGEIIDQNTALVVIDYSQSK